MMDIVIRKCGVRGCRCSVQASGYCDGHDRQARAGVPFTHKEPKPDRKAWLRVHSHFGGDECLIYPPATKRPDYYTIRVNGTVTAVHRWMCESANGAPAEGMEAAHSCGNGHLGCVNPKHLRWATPKENQHDRVIHRTDGRGERSATARLRSNEVLEIRRRYVRGNGTALAAEFNVSPQAILDIMHQRTWRHV